MKSLLLALSVIVASAGMMPLSADAKRIGSGNSSGMKRDMPARSAPDATPAKPAGPAAAAAPATAGAAAAAAAPKRSWMGPIAGLAAGLGIAALMSSMGLGDELANFVMLALLAVVAFVAIRFLLRRFGPQAGAAAGARQGPQLAGAGASAGGNAGSFGMQRTAEVESATSRLPGGSSSTWGPSAVAPEQSAAASFGAAAARTVSLPADFDAPAFERVAKMIFIRMQAANDAGDLNDLRNFTTPELFAAIKLDLQDRGGVAQTTDVEKIDAQVVDYAAEADRNVVSVRFTGLVREEQDAAATEVDEVWHLVKPTDGSREWAIAGIQQYA
ncbi:MAG: preprotein translocase subunit Tim44 [Methylibium sp. NZG]|nr:MAG: preprotein translocase subunit Tim44 [Methylibium sp. NZG]